MNEDSIGVNRGQVVDQQLEQHPVNPLDLTVSKSKLEDSPDSSPTLSIFSSFNSQSNNINNNNYAISSISESLKSPVNLSLCSVALVLVSGLWLAAGYFIQTLTPLYDSPSMLTYISVISLQFYFFLIPKRSNYPKTRVDGTLSINESDLGFDTFTNREV